MRALQDKGILQVLAEPNLTAINGQTAKFLAGGEFPFPVIQGSNGGFTSVTIQFRPYGVKLEFTPYVNPDGTIRLKVSPEVSALGLHQRREDIWLYHPGNFHAQGRHRDRAQGRSKLRDLRPTRPSHYGQFEQDPRHRRYTHPRATVSFPEPEPFHHRADRHRHADHRPSHSKSTSERPAVPTWPVPFMPPSEFDKGLPGATKVTPGQSSADMHQ